MSRTPSAHWISDSLSKRVPYTDTLKYDPYEISLGYGHQEISHLLFIIQDEESPKANKLKSFMLLSELFTGREAESIQLKAFEVLKPYLLEPPNSLLLNTLICMEKLVNTKQNAMIIADYIPRIAQIAHPEIEVPLRYASASLLVKLAEFVGPIPQFIEGDVPVLLTVATVASKSQKPLLTIMFYLLSRLTNVQNVRVPVISSKDLLTILVESIDDDDLRKNAMILAQNIAMDRSHHGKTALLQSDILQKMLPLLNSGDIDTRMSALSLIALLAVPKDGKEFLSKLPDIANRLKEISEIDSDLNCRRAAYKCRIFIAELPAGRAIIGHVVDPSVPIPKNVWDSPLPDVVEEAVAQDTAAEETSSSQYVFKEKASNLVNREEEKESQEDALSHDNVAEEPSVNEVKGESDEEIPINS